MSRKLSIVKQSFGIHEYSVVLFEVTTVLFEMTIVILAAKSYTIVYQL